LEIFYKKKIELDGFSHENPNPILKVWEGKWVGWNYGLGLEVVAFKVYDSTSTMGIVSGEGYKTQKVFWPC
jgi:hypothetical protein